ncbi:MAG: GAF domain-containing protein, partial [Planctomycetia bacterium]
MRIPVAEPRESEVSRRQARLEGLAGDRVRLTNLSTAIAIRCFGQADVAPGGSVDHALPVSFQIGRVVVSVAAESAVEQAAAGAHLQTLEQPPDLPPAAGSAAAPGGLRQQQRITELIDGTQGADVQGLVRWWREVIGVLQSASNSNDFFHKAAAAIVDLVGLDMGAVFLRADGGWKPAAIASSERSQARPSTNVLARVLAEKRTFWNKVDQNVDVLSSLAILEAYVAAPILDRNGEVLGALYGHREGGGAGRSEITQLEALVVETLACGVAAGLSRLEQEKA